MTTHPASNTDDLTRFFRGDAIYGDDFSQPEIDAWYEDEREGYANLYHNETGRDYPYHAQNWVHGYRHILTPARRFRDVLGFGSAFGDELLPVVPHTDRFTIIDPSDQFVRTDVGGVPARWVKPQPSGTLPFDDRSFDLITCFGVLHHIPNVSHVVRELARVMRPGAVLLVREPVVSMGDWRRPRRGVTKRERGLPLNPFLASIRTAGLTTRRLTHCMFPPVLKLSRAVGINPLGNRAVVHLDAICSTLFTWNYRYHAANTFQKFTPACVFLVLEKPHGDAQKSG